MNLGRMNETDIKVFPKKVLPGHTNSTEVTKLLAISIPSPLGRKQAIHLFL